MQHFILFEAKKLQDRFGARALAEAARLLEAATAARDHKTGMFYAEICQALQT